ncbi:phosphoribosyltransferase [Crocosphaera sp. XPORK-15E]|uniref:phosphoribosyltransferase n=1 Tax=Crocosphaera sp. XPORK-15E TaxID=3110247 RepID=UPI002B20F2AB|nr:phosphoribosyltransferase family protein [Crocosphaera sp. XPORK-15E]MEA5534388.1 phosphoribosyltransferase family protein [Crocosphaera sp. XPORK-15E]
MSDLYVSWEEYHQQIETLAVQIYQSNWQFNQIVCIAKGGLRVGDILSRLYDIPLAIVAAASYGGIDNRLREKLNIGEHLAMTNKKLGNRILLVDDLVDSGVSLQQVSQWLKDSSLSDIQEMKTAVIWYKSCSVFKPDYYVEYLSDNPWIHQPFERYETMTLKELVGFNGR